MLRSLHAEDLILVERAELAFLPGLNVLTGETGTGKSLLLDALRLILGGRGGGELVRPGARSARVTALFDLPTGPSGELLAEMGQDPADGEVLVQREIAGDGRSTARLNGRPVTVGMLRQLGRELVTIAGQGEQHRLDDPAEQLRYLDRSGGSELATSVAALEAVYTRWRSAVDVVASLGGERSDVERRREGLRFAVQEIAAAQLTPGEDARLQRRREVLQQGERIGAALAASLETLLDGDAAIAARLGAIGREIASLGRLDPDLEEPGLLLQDAEVAVQEAARVLRRYADGLTFDPAEQTRVEERWNRLGDLKRKYGGSDREILAYQAQATAELERLDALEQTMTAARQAAQEAARALGAAAASVSGLRQRAALRLREQIATELAELGMGAARFAVELERVADPTGIPVEGEAVACGRTGCDRVQFLWGANPGQGLGPLQRIASGGERSRLLLALYSLWAAEVDVPTVVFDEIDAGVGGRAAQAVATRLARIGRTRQVLCVTHLATVAAAAERHFTVEKDTSGDQTIVSVREVAGPDRIREIARMLDGDRGATSRRHAEELLQRAVHC